MRGGGGVRGSEGGVRGSEGGVRGMYGQLGKSVILREKFTLEKESWGLFFTLLEHWQNSPLVR